MVDLRNKDVVQKMALHLEWVGEEDCPIRFGNDINAGPYDLDWADILEIRHLAKDREKVLEPTEIPGPIDWTAASHWIEYDHDHRTVETWCKMGPEYKYRLRTKVRPMVGSELIYSLLKDYTREEVLKAFGVELPLPIVERHKDTRSWIQKIWR